MTAIVAAVVRDRIVMAGDSLTTHGPGVDASSRPKVWATAPFVFGGAGCVRTLQVLQYHVDWPTYRPSENADNFERWAVTKVVPEIRTASRDRGVLHSDSGIDHINATLLFAVGTQLAEIAHNGAVVINPFGRAAIGSGKFEALGRLGSRGPWTERDVVDAVRRAAQTDPSVGGPITITDTKTLRVRQVE